jgi:osmotically-inducible protein OsmY
MSSARSHLGALAASAVAGAGAAYFLDPSQGRSRRARTRDKLGARSRRTVRQVERKVRYERGRARGAWHHVHPGDAAGPVDDRVLADRVRSEVLGRTGASSAVNVDVVRGVVSLRGELPDQQAIIDLRDQVAELPGVDAVVTLLHLPGTMAPNKEPARRL